MAAQIDVIIPAVRAAACVGKALYSLSRNSVRPQLVTVVSNELDDDLPTHGLDVRLIRFASEHYPVGDRDVALRRDIGIWLSPCSHVLTFDDDQLAPPNLIEASLAILGRRPYCWGHYRFTDFSRYGLDALLALRPEQGRTREHPANAWHGWMSCYGGLFAAERQLVQAVGGFDLIFCGRHAGEDQNLGRRLAWHLDRSERVFIHEPPFAWHPEQRIPWGTPRYTNLCPCGHRLEVTRRGWVDLLQCRACPYFEVVRGELFGTGVAIPFDLDRITTRISELRGPREQTAPHG